MKKIIILLFASLILVGCGSNQEEIKTHGVTEVEVDQVMSEAEVKQNLKAVKNINLQLEEVMQMDVTYSSSPLQKVILIEELATNENFQEALNLNQELDNLKDNSGKNHEQIISLENNINIIKQNLVSDGFTSEQVDTFLEIEDISEQINSYAELSKTVIFETGEIVSQDYKTEYDLVKSSLMSLPEMKSFGPPPVEVIKQFVDDKMYLDEGKCDLITNEDYKNRCLDLQ